MEFKQGTLAEILESEKLMVLTAPERYGKYYDHAVECSFFLSHFTKSVDADRWVFAGFLSQVKKHHMLALFSTVRLHQIQSTMNLRQVLEAGACAAFAIANPEHHHFVDTTDDGLLDPSPKLTKKRYAWLDQNYPDASKSIHEMKSQINVATAHANFIHTQNNFHVSETKRQFDAPFFDIEDPYFVKADLWRIGNIAISLLDLFYGVNQGRDVVKFVDDFSLRFGALVIQSKELHAEMTSSERYKRAMQIANRSG